MKTCKLVFLILVMVLLIPFNLKTIAQQSAQNKPKELVIAYELPGMGDVIVKNDIPYLVDADSTLKMDIYYPPNFDFKRKIPAVIIVYGYTNKAQKKMIGKPFKNWSWFVSWCRIISTSGIAAIVYETNNPDNDIIAVSNYLKSNEDKLQIDNTKIGAFTLSAHTPTAITTILNGSNDIFKCAVVYYGFFLTKDFKYLTQIDSISRNMGFITPRLSEPTSWKTNVPIMIVRAGKDDVPFINQSLLSFYNNAINQNLPITLINYPTGSHGFDAYNDNETTRQIIKSTLEFWKFHLK